MDTVLNPKESFGVDLLTNVLGILAQKSRNLDIGVEPTHNLHIDRQSLTSFETFPYQAYFNTSPN